MHLIIQRERGKHLLPEVPWKRLIRTLSLQNSVTFGTINEANDSATRIKLHEVIKGEDNITGKIDALIMITFMGSRLSSIIFNRLYEKTVKKLLMMKKINIIKKIYCLQS